MTEVYKAIAAVQGALSKVGITKDSENTMQNYKFRGIDDVYNALSPLLAEHGLVIIPRIIEREETVRQTNRGGTIFSVSVKAEFDFISAKDGSTHTASTFGEAMDSGDKATNKAMSAAYKYAAFMTFAIPTEGDNDADAVTHEVEFSAKIEDGQRDQLMALCQAADVSLTALLGWASEKTRIEIADMRDIPATFYQPMLNKLNASIEANKQKTDGKPDGMELDDEVPF